MLSVDEFCIPPLKHIRYYFMHERLDFSYLLVLFLLILDILSFIFQRTSCEQSCLGNCMDMKCKANSCHLTCLEDNCKITCRGTGTTPGCYPRCRGRGCLIDVYSLHAEPWCIKGSCIVRMSKISNGRLSCPGGNCTFTCAKGTHCAFNGACPNCTGPIFVDDPFATTPLVSSTTRAMTMSTKANAGPRDSLCLGKGVLIFYILGLLMALSALQA